MNPRHPRCSHLCPHPRQDWARHICTGTTLAPPHLAPGLATQTPASCVALPHGNRRPLASAQWRLAAITRGGMAWRRPGSRMLRSGGRLLRCPDPCRILSVLLHGVCCTVSVARCMLRVACCPSRCTARCMLRALSHVAALRVACRVISCLLSGRPLHAVATRCQRAHRRSAPFELVCADALRLRDVGSAGRRSVAYTAMRSLITA